MLKHTHSVLWYLRTLFAMVVIALIASPPALAESARKLDLTTPRQRANAPKQAARPRSVSCSEFGPGFMRMAGSDSCVSINGAVELGAGVGPGR